MVKKFSKIGVCMVFVLSMILPQAAVSKAKTANPYTGKKYIYCSNYKDGIELYGKDGSKKKKYTLIKKVFNEGNLQDEKLYLLLQSKSEGFVDRLCMAGSVEPKDRKVKSKKEKEIVLCQRMAGVPLCDG